MFLLSTGPTAYEAREWVRIKHSGPRMNRVSPGGRVELECEANGSPPPSVQWFHNNIPLSEVSSFQMFAYNNVFSSDTSDMVIF